jgi:hypothetical protein
MRTVWPHEGQTTSCPELVPGMKKFQPHVQFSEILAMSRLSFRHSIARRAAAPKSR